MKLEMKEYNADNFPHYFWSEGKCIHNKIPHIGNRNAFFNLQFCEDLASEFGIEEVDSVMDIFYRTPYTEQRLLGECIANIFLTDGFIEKMIDNDLAINEEITVILRNLYTLIGEKLSNRAKEISDYIIYYVKSIYILENFIKNKDLSFKEEFSKIPASVAQAYAQREHVPLALFEFDDYFKEHLKSMLTQKISCKEQIFEKINNKILPMNGTPKELSMPEISHFLFVNENLRSSVFRHITMKIDKETDKFKKQMKFFFKFIIFPHENALIMKFIDYSDREYSTSFYMHHFSLPVNNEIPKHAVISDFICKYTKENGVFTSKNIHEHDIITKRERENNVIYYPGGSFLLHMGKCTKKNIYLHNLLQSELYARLCSKYNVTENCNIMKYLYSYNLCREHFNGVPLDKIQDLDFVCSVICDEIINFATTFTIIKNKLSRAYRDREYYNSIVCKIFSMESTSMENNISGYINNYRLNCFTTTEGLHKIGIVDIPTLNLAICNHPIIRMGVLRVMDRYKQSWNDAPMGIPLDARKQIELLTEFLLHKHPIIS